MGGVVGRGGVVGGVVGGGTVGVAVGTAVAVAVGAGGSVGLAVRRGVGVRVGAGSGVAGCVATGTRTATVVGRATGVGDEGTLPTVADGWPRPKVNTRAAATITRAPAVSPISRGSQERRRGAELAGVGAGSGPALAGGGVPARRGGGEGGALD